MDGFANITLILDQFCKTINNRTEFENVSYASTHSPMFVTYDYMNYTTNVTNVSSFDEKVIISSVLFNSETYAIPTISVMGIVFNILLISILSKDRNVVGSTCKLMKTLFCMEILYLSSVLVFVSVRRTTLRDSLDVMSYVTSAMSVGLFAMNWTFLVMVYDSYRVLHLLCGGASSSSRGVLQMALIIVSALIFHVPYIPYIRIQFHRFQPIFDPCRVPIEYQWDLNTANTGPTDWYYVGYFAMFYFVVLFALPFFFVGCVDKDIIDLLHRLTGRGGVPLDVIHAANTAMTTSILSNVYLVCISIKAIIMGFRIVNQFCLLFRGHVHMFFFFMNASGNVMILLRPVLNFIVFVLYSPQMCGIVRQMMCGTKDYRHLAAEKAKTTSQFTLKA